MFTLNRSVYPSSSSTHINSVLERYKLCGHKTKIQKVLYGNAVSTVDNAKIERITKATKNKIKLNNKYIKYIEV